MSIAVLFALLPASVLAVNPYSKVDPRHWPPGRRTETLEPYLASVTNCLTNANTSSPCGPLVRGRLDASADWCTRWDDYVSGRRSLTEVLLGTTIDVILIPAADDMVWEEAISGASSGRIGGFVGDVLRSIANSGGFRVNAYIIRKPDGSASDPYKGSYTGLLLDWAPRADMVMNWWTDVVGRRAEGVIYLASFYRLDLQLLAVQKRAPASSSGTIGLLNFNFLKPFHGYLWVVIATCVIFFGFLERFLDGKLSKSHLLSHSTIHASAARLAMTRDANMPPAGSVAIAARWVPLDSKDREGGGTLQVGLRSGSDLLAADYTGTSDPYAILRFGSQHFRSDVVRKTLNPTWDEVFVFTCTSLDECASQSLRIEVYDYDRALMRSSSKQALQANSPTRTRRPVVPGAADDFLGETSVELAMLKERNDSGVLVSELHIPPSDPNKLAAQLQPIARRFRFLMRGSELAFGAMNTFLAFIEGGGYRSESTSLSGRVLILGWCFACSILNASYTANLAAITVSSNFVETGGLSATSFEQIRTARLPICVRGGTAPAGLVARYLPEDHPIVYLSAPSVTEGHALAAQKIRAGECAGYAVTYWESSLVLVGTANTGCDLRITGGPISTIPARGGYASASPLLRQQAQLQAHGPELAAAAAPLAQCSAAPTYALSALLLQWENEHFHAARNAYVDRARNSSCTQSGEPAEGAKEVDLDTAQIHVENLGGLFFVLIVVAFLAIICAPQVQSLFNWCRRLIPGAKLHHVAPAAGISSIEAIREFFQPPLQPSDWRELVDEKLQRIEASLAQVTSLATPSSTNFDRPAVVGKEGSHDQQKEGEVPVAPVFYTNGIILKSDAKTAATADATADATTAPRLVLDDSQLQLHTPYKHEVGKGQWC